MTDGKYSFKIALDDKELVMNVEQAKKTFDSLVKAAREAGVKIDGSFKNPFENLTVPTNAAKNITGVTQSFNGLTMSTQQLVRELPAATMGLNTFFLAISNNLPIFADQVKAASAANRELVAQGKPVKSVFSQILSSLASWQTALVLGVSALAMYGKEIGNWIAGLFKGKEAVDSITAAQETLLATIKEQGLGIGDDIVKVKALSDEYKALGDNMKAQQKFIEDNKSAFEELGVAVTDVADADTLLIDRTPEFIEAMKLRAQATAAQKLAAEQYERALKAEIEASEKQTEVDRMPDSLVSGYDPIYTRTRTGVKTTGYKARYVTNTAKAEAQDEIDALNATAEAARNLADSYFEVATAKNNAADELLDDAGISTATNTAARAVTADWNTNEEEENRRFAAQLQRDLADRQKAWNEYYMEYGTFQEKLLYTTRHYNQLIAEAQTMGERKALEAERDAVLAQFAVEASDWAKELSAKTMQELDAMLADLEAQVKAKEEAFSALDSSNTDVAKDYQQTINTLNAQIALLKQRLGEADEAVENNNWADAAQVIQGIASAASTAANSLKGVDNGLASVLSTMSQFASTAASLVGAISAITSATTGLQAALGLIGLMAAAVQVIGTLAGNIGAFRREVNESIDSLKELNKELERTAQLSRINSDAGTIFGEDAFANFTNNLNVMREALERYGRSQEAIIARGKEVAQTTVRAMENTAHYANEDLVKQQHEWENAYESIANMQVQLSKGNLFRDAKYSSLAEMLPELFTGGELNMELLEQLQNSDMYDKLSKENRALIDDLIANWQLYNDAVEASNEYLKSIFGELGNEINNAIVDAFENGTDAALAFGDAAGKMLENLISQIGYTAYIAPIMSKAMAEVEALNGQGMSSEDYLNELMRIVGDAMDAAEAAVGGYNDFLAEADKRAESYGINTFDDASVEASRRGIAQASQQSIDELNGRATAIQSHTYSIMEGTKQLTRDSAQMLRHLAGIENNTSRLGAMESSLKRMESNIDRMANRGVKMI